MPLINAAGIAMGIVAAANESLSLEDGIHSRRMLQGIKPDGGDPARGETAGDDVDLSFRDYLAIQNLLSRYLLALDSGDVEAHMACWVEDERDFQGFYNLALGNFTTLADMRRAQEAMSGPRGLVYGKRHHATNIVIQPVNKNLVLVTHYLLLLETRCPPYVVATNVYPESRVVRTKKGWRFQKRVVVVDPGFFPLFTSWVQQGIYGMDGMKIGDGTVDRCSDAGTYA
eukprot:jgi/Mesvir1/5257/Mv15374-RA.1